MPCFARGRKYTQFVAMLDDFCRMLLPVLFMIALCNRADHYIFILWFLILLLSFYLFFLA